MDGRLINEALEERRIHRTVVNWITTEDAVISVSTARPTREISSVLESGVWIGLPQGAT